MAGWINRQVQNATSAAGNMAGGAVNAVGNGINGAGQSLGNKSASTTSRAGGSNADDDGSINKTTLGWANATREYGNSIKDATNAKGNRAATGANPLGLAKTPTSVKYDNQRKSQASRQTGRDPLGISGKY